MKRGSTLDKSIFAFVSIALVSLSIALIVMENPSITGNATIQTISYLKQGSTLEIEVRNVPNVQKAVIKVIKDVKNTKVFLDETTAPSFNGYILSTFNISSERGENFGEVTLTLKVKESDLVSINEDDLKVYLENVALPTEISQKVGDYIYYKATSPKIGVFVIGKANVEIEEPQPEVVTLPVEPIAEEPVVKKGFFSRIADWFKSLFS